ncbi:MAG: caspase family protein [Pseudomonadota bacterium]
MILPLLACAAMAGPAVIPGGAVDPREAGALFHGRRLALLVGPESYTDDGFPDLRYTAADARALGTALADQGRFDRVVTLTTPAETTRAAVLSAMRTLGAEVQSPDDVVFVYFSTHGSLARGQGEALQQELVLSDTRLEDLRGTGLAQDEVLDWLASLPSRREVLLLATCHAGQGKSVRSPDMDAAQQGTKGLAVPPLPEVSEALVVIGVCAFDEVARESDELGHDIYTWFFLQALGDGDLDGDGAVTVTEAHDAARRGTWDFTQGTQRAYAMAEITGADPIVLAGQREQPGQGLLASYWERLAGLSVLLDGAVKGELPGQVPVPPGTHVITLEDARGRVVARQRLRLAEGDRLDAGKLLARDHVRLATGLGVATFGVAGVPTGPVGSAELHLPRWPGRGWELIAHGSAMARWPRPVLEGGLTLEHPLRYGTWQLRGGLDLHGYLLRDDPDTHWFRDEARVDGEEPLLAPGLAPWPELSLAWLPPYPAMARLSLAGGYVWYTERGAWHHGWGGGLTFVLGGRF